MSDTNEDESLKDQLFVIELRELLDRGESDEAAKHFDKDEPEGVVARNLWEIVPILSSHLTLKNKIGNRHVFETCENLMEAASKKCNPREMLMPLLDRVKNAEDEVSFECLLITLRGCLTRSGIDRVVDWCVDSIEDYARNLPQPENDKPRADETQIDAIAERLTKDYRSVLSFLEPFTTECALGQSCKAKTRNYLLSLHLFLFGHPFCYLTTKDERDIFETTMTRVSLLTGNFLKFHAIIEDRMRRSGRRRKNSANSDEDEDEQNAEIELFRSERRVSNLAYGNYYYHILNSEEGRKNLPQVYNPHYLMHGCFYLASFMIKQSEYVIVTKGLKIIETTLGKIDKFSIGHEVFEIPVHDDLFASLAQVMIYCDADEDRKLALNVFQAYVERFTIKARYSILLKLYETVKHSGFLALLTGITKASIIHCLDKDPECKYFLAGKFERLMKIICRLPDGSQSDFVDISDQVIAALNLIRFLTIRDRDNSTGIWTMMVDLENDYLKPVREGVDLSRAHWEATIKLTEDAQELMKSSDGSVAEHENETFENDVTVSVGGQDLPKMPATEKIKFCLQALNALDVIKCIVHRVNECIAQNSP